MMNSVVQTFKDSERWLSSLSSNETNLLRERVTIFPSNNLFPVPGKTQLVVREKNVIAKVVVMLSCVQLFAIPWIPWASGSPAQTHA